MPQLFLACSTKIVTMATLGGQPSKEMHCEHRNSRALSSKREGGWYWVSNMGERAGPPASLTLGSSPGMLGIVRPFPAPRLLFPEREQTCELWTTAASHLDISCRGSGSTARLSNMALSWILPRPLAAGLSSSLSFSSMEQTDERRHLVLGNLWTKDTCGRY